MALQPRLATEAAVAIVALINSWPRSPRQDEIEAILSRSGTGPAPDVPIPARRIRWSDVDFKPVVNPETGKPLSFDFTNDEFGLSFLPSVRLAFCILARDREGVADFVRGLTEDPADPKAEALFQLLDNWRIVQNKFEAIARLAEAASARVMAVTMASGEQRAEEAVS